MKTNQDQAIDIKASILDLATRSLNAYNDLLVLTDDDLIISEGVEILKALQASIKQDLKLLG